MIKFYSKKYNIDLNNPVDSLQRIDKMISHLFDLNNLGSKELTKTLNNLLQIHHFLVRKIYFITKESNQNETY